MAAYQKVGKRQHAIHVLIGQAGKHILLTRQKLFSFLDSMADSRSMMLGGMRFSVDKRDVDLICGELASEPRQT